MDLSFIANYISPIALVICLAIGYILKNIVTTDTINRFIPLISAVIGLIVVCWASWDFTPELVAAGLISGLAATGLYEAFKGVITQKNLVTISKSDIEDMTDTEDDLEDEEETDSEEASE